MKPIFFPSMCILSTEIYFISHEIVYFCTKLLNSNSMFILKCRLIGRRNYSKLESGRFAFHILWFFREVQQTVESGQVHFTPSLFYTVLYTRHTPLPPQKNNTHTAVYNGDTNGFQSYELTSITVTNNVIHYPNRFLLITMASTFHMTSK